MKEYGAVVRAAFEHYDLPSIAVGVYDHGETAYLCYGMDDATGRAPTERTRYMIGSASKSFIATAVCRLASEGRIDLDQPVSRYLPDLAFFTQEMTDRITVRQILSHQTGIPRHDASWVDRDGGTLDATVRSIRFLEPAFGIGERFHYQNHMYALASKLVEQVSGMRWQDYVRQSILEPLGMGRTWTDTSLFGAEGTDCVRPWARRDGRNVPWAIWRSDAMGCAACMTSTVEDELRWQVCNLHGGVHEGARVFDGWAASQLHSPQMPIREFEMYGYPMADVDISESSYGLGWFIEVQSGQTVVHHGGTVGGFRSECGFVPGCDVAFAVFANLDGTQAVNAVERGIVDVASGREPRDWCMAYDAASATARERSRAAMAPLLAAAGDDFSDAACDGVYWNPAYGQVRVGSLGDGTTRIWFWGRPLKMRHVGGDLLMIDALELANMAVPARFVRDGGRVVALAAKLEPEIRSFIMFTRV